MATDPTGTDDGVKLEALEAAWAIERERWAEYRAAGYAYEAARAAWREAIGAVEAARETLEARRGDVCPGSNQPAVSIGVSVTAGRCPRCDFTFSTMQPARAVTPRHWPLVTPSHRPLDEHEQHEGGG